MWEVVKLRWVASTDTLQGFCGVKLSNGHKCVHDFAPVVGDEGQGYTNIVNAFQSNVKAGYARVLLANPLPEHLPALLIVTMCTCNTFEATDISLQWQHVEKMWVEHCLAEVGPIVGHASDGDSRRRRLMLRDYYRRSSSSNFEIKWDGFYLKGQFDMQGNVNGLHDQDWIHKVKKLISPLDNTTRLLLLGPFVARMEHIQKLFNTLTFDEHGLNVDDVHMKDRQNFKSAQLLCSRKVVAALAKMRVDS